MGDGSKEECIQEHGGMREELAEGVTLYCGDCREILPTLAPNHVIADPPYEDELHKAMGRDMFIEKPKPAKQEALL